MDSRNKLRRTKPRGLRFESLEHREVFASSPVVAIADASALEGNSGRSNENFLVFLDKTSRSNVTVNVNTSSGSARSGSDFSSVSRSVTIPRGELSVLVPVSILGDTNVEADETFRVTISSPRNARLGRSVATGTIVNDDSPAPPPEPPTPPTPPTTGYGLTGPIGPQQGVTAPAGSILLSASSSTSINQRLIDNAPAGSTIFFQAGTYTDLSISVKPGTTYLGEFGAVLTSSSKLRAFSGSGTASQPVTVSNLVVNGYKPPSQQAAILGGDYFRIDRVEVRNSATGGVQVGSHSKITNSYIHDNGQLGVEGYSTDNAATDIVVDNCRVSRNNPANAFDFVDVAGGSKFWNVTNLTVTNCEFDNNVGDGIWMDGNLAGGGGKNVTIAGNWCHDNGRYGIFQEIGGSALITGNLVENNGMTGLRMRNGVLVEGDGIHIDNSEGVTITGNVVRNNYHGIVLQSYTRSDTSHRLRNITVTGNTVIMTRGTTGVRENTSLTSGIVFDNNTYELSGSAAFVWGNNWGVTWAQWQARGFDLHSTMVRVGPALAYGGSSMIVITERPLRARELRRLRAIAPVTHQELARLLGISAARVQQLEAQALKKIRAAMIS
jgi:parallel beta-helix repeat protein